VLTAALALVALPGLAGSRTPSPFEPIPAGAFQPLSVTADKASDAISIAGFETGFGSAAAVDDQTRFIEPGEAPESGPTSRRTVNQPDPNGTSSRKPAKYSLRGEATFYDAGYTAMRLPRGTTVIICGAAGCIERVVGDYGPEKPSRIVDLYRPDFFKICGCASWSGVTNVTVFVY